ncbi:MAG TPA: PA14 domain-containing protein, partial [Pirellulales bacterium]|nr:PA14 domain-containing protein [Pirellulales bacterium]
GDHFLEVDVLAAKEEAIIGGLLKTTSAEQAVNDLMVSLLVIDRAAGEGQVDRAERLLAAAETATRKLGAPALVAAVQKRRTMLSALKTAAQKNQSALERLKSAADDAEAHQAAGLYQSLALGDWKGGLSHLAKASPPFAEIARLEASAEGEPADRPPLAAAWRAVADETPLWKAACLSQAQYWCDRALATRVGKSDPAIVALGDELKSLAVLNRPRLKPGLQTVLYEGADFQNPRVWRVDPNLDFNSGYGPPAPGLPGDYFSIRWTGWLVPPMGGNYVLKTYSDDSVRVRIDDKLVIDHWNRGAGDDKAEVKLTDAPHRLVVEFNDYQVTAAVFLSWSLKDASGQHAIPVEALFHDPALD